MKLNSIHLARWLLVDAVVVLVALALGVFVRSLTANIDINKALFFAVVAVVAVWIINTAFRLFNRSWSFSSVNQAVWIVGSVVVEFALLLAFDMLFNSQSYLLPRWILVIAAAVCVIGFLATRFRRAH
jgi:FlaA1/EpsC-like NDP-sugar epimerase